MRNIVSLRPHDRAELWSGIAASLFGLAALAFTLFAPRLREGTRGPGNTTVFHYVSGIQLGQPPAYLVIFAVLALVICGFALGVMAHLSSRRLIWGRVLLGLTALLVLWILYPFSYPVAVPLRLSYLLQDNGVFLPVLVLAVVATVLALRDPGIQSHAT